MTKRPGVGVAIGRFQIHELHAGHLALIRKADEHHKLVVFIGVSRNLVTRTNPLDYPAREQMVREIFPHAVTAPLPDCPTDEEWSQNVDRWIAAVMPTDPATIYFGRDSSIAHYKGRCKTVEIDQVPHVSATDIRAEVGKTIECASAWRAGVIYAAHAMWPRSIPVVDIAITRTVEGRREVLLGKRHNERGQVRFPGGHVDIGDETCEAAALREVREETGLEVSAPEYIGSYRVKSWSDDANPGYLTTFFHCEYTFGPAEGSDDLDAVTWVPLEQLQQLQFADSHAMLAAELVKHLQRKG